MPHAFKATPDHPTVAYLVRLHADIGGKLLDNKKEAARLASSMLAVEHVIKLFDPDFNARTISARRRQKTNPWFKRGTLFRKALDVLRTATGPLTVAEVHGGRPSRQGHPRSYGQAAERHCGRDTVMPRNECR